MSGRLVLAGILATALACGTTRRARQDALDSEPSGAWYDEFDKPEEARSLANGELLALTQAADPAVRARALWALGRIQNPAAVEWVLPPLADPEARVRAEAAFAAGLLAQSWDPIPEYQRDALARGLLDAEAHEKDPQARARMLEALGKTPALPALDRLVERLGDADAAVRAKAAVSLGVAARKGAKLDERAVQAAFPLLASAAPVAVRYGAAYLLAFSKQPSARAALVQCLEDSDAETRALCARGLADVAQPEDAAALGKHLDDADARVAAEAARALSRLSMKCDAPDCGALVALGKLGSRISQVERGELSAGLPPLLALAQQGVAEKGRGVLEQLHKQIGEALARQPNATDLAWLDCRYAAAIDKLDRALSRTLSCGGSRVSDVRRISLGLREVARGLGDGPVPEATSSPWIQYLSNPSAQVRSAALEALSKAPSAAPKIRALIADPDPVVAANAVYASATMKDAEALAPAMALLDRIPELEDRAALAEPLVELAQSGPGASEGQVKPLEALLRRWLVAGHASVRTNAAAALSKLTARAVRPPFIDPWPSAVEVEPVRGEALLVFTTDKGAFKVRLDGREMPWTSENMLELARSRFFDGLVFHRVVPGFVAQGGDPRGDGEGGPGYRIRCEIGHAPYTRGSLGMALSGKDTGGSQFFVALSAQPHLDGRYTRFGEVIEGMDVVDRLDEGDVMRSVRVVGP